MGGVIDARYLPSVMKGILDVMENGPLTKSYARDIRVLVYDGKMHAVDSNDISFKLAGAYAFKEAFLNASPKLMEPVNDISIKIPESMTGSVMTELQTKRAVIQGINTEGNYQIIKGQIPKAELDNFSTQLRSITQGRGTFSTTLKGYEPVPANVQQQLINGLKTKTVEV